MVNAAHPAPGSPPYAQQLVAREEVSQMWVEGVPRVAAGAGRGIRGVRRGGESAGPEPRIAFGTEDGRECPDRGWVKMIAVAVVGCGGGMVYSQDSRG